MNRLKITEPKLDVRDVLPLSQLDVLITPLVAFDEQGQRLGMGGGFTTGRCKTGGSMGCSRWAMRMIAGCRSLAGGEMGYSAACGGNAVKRGFGSIKPGGGYAYPAYKAQRRSGKA